jgi:hypothetical protein
VYGARPGPTHMEPREVWPRIGIAGHNLAIEHGRFCWQLVQQLRAPLSWCGKCSCKGATTIQIPGWCGLQTLGARMAGPGLINAKGPRAEGGADAVLLGPNLVLTGQGRAVSSVSETCLGGESSDNGWVLVLAIPPRV